MERSREHLLRESGERTKARREADEARDALAKA